MALRRIPHYAGFLLTLFVLAGQPSVAEAQQKAKKSAPNQYTVPSDQERWYDRSCNTFNT